MSEGFLAGHDFSTLQARLQRQVDTTDKGEQMPETAAALAQSDPVVRLSMLVRALGSERVLVGAQVASSHHADEPCHRLPQVADAQGQVTSVVFSSVETLQSFDATARPVPVSGQEAAQMALATSGGRLWVDASRNDNGAGLINSSDASAGALVRGSGGVRLPRPAVKALAQGSQWVPAWEDQQLSAHLRTYRDEVVAFLRILPSADPEVVLRIGVQARASRAQVEAALVRIGRDTRLLAAVEHLQLQPVWAQLA